MTLEEMLKGIDEFFEEYTPESFCKMLEDDFDVKFKDEKVDTLVGNFEFKKSYESLWKNCNLSAVPVFKKSDFTVCSEISALYKGNENIFSENDEKFSGVAA